MIVGNAKIEIGALSLERKHFFVVVGLITVAPALVLGLFPRGGTHGLYCDDYSFRAWAFDFETGGWRPQLVPHPALANLRYLHHILAPNVLSAIPAYELAYSMLGAAIQLANALLLGLFAYRIVRTPLVLIASTWLFLMPAVANEAVVWHSNTTQYLMGTLVFLLGLHTFLSAISKSSHALLVAAALLLGTVLLFTEATVFLVLLFPFLSAIAVRGDRQVRVKAVIQGTVLCVLMSFGYILYWHFVLSHAPNLAVRGGAELDPIFVVAQRLPTVWSNVIWLVTDWGIRGPLAEAFELGMRDWSRTWTGGMLLAAFLSGVLTLVCSYRPAGKGHQAGLPVVWSTVVAGLVWPGLALVPILLVRNQIAEIRLLYLVWAGLSIAIAAFIQGVADVSGRWRVWVARVGILAVACILLVSSLTMAGIVRVYQLRWDLDQRQLGSLRSVIPRLPEDSPVWVLPIALDERSVSPTLGKDVALDRYLFGVFETSWSAAGALQMAYRRPDIHAVASNRWDRLHLTGVSRSREGEVVEIIIQNTRVPVRQLLAFTYQEGRVILLNPIVIGPNDGGDIVVNLPLVARWGRPGSSVQPVHIDLDSFEIGDSAADAAANGRRTTGAQLGNSQPVD